MSYRVLAKLVIMFLHFLFVTVCNNNFVYVHLCCVVADHFPSYSLKFTIEQTVDSTR